MPFERLAIDANAAIDSLRPQRPFPIPLKDTRRLFMPLFVLAELRLGVERSRQTEENAARVDALIARCEVIAADLDTIPFYIRIRNDLAKTRTVPHSLEKREGFGHDIWIAALCLQHQLPLLTTILCLTRSAHSKWFIGEPPVPAGWPGDVSRQLAADSASPRRHQPAMRRESLSMSLHE